MITKIQLIRNESCTAWLKAKDMLTQVLTERNFNIPIEIIVLKTDEETKAHKFFGSPQININNEDVDPASEQMKAYHISGCRVYMYNNQSYEYPPREMILKAFTRHEQA